MKKEPYIVSFSKMLFSYLHAEGVAANQACDYIGEKIEAMLLCEPNLAKNKRRSSHNGIKQVSNAWVLRDYYPGTSVMFKVTITETEGNDMLHGMDAFYFIKVYYVPPIKYDKRITVDGSKLRKRYYDRVFEKAIFCADSHYVDHLVDVTFNAARRMAPRGFKLLPLKRNKGRVK